MTIADSEGCILFCLQKAMEHFGYPVKDQKLVRPVIGNTPELMLAFMSGETDKEKIQSMKTWYRNFSLGQSGKITFFPGVREGLQQLHESGIKIGILSLKFYQLMHIPLERDGILPYIDRISGAEQVTAPKPSPEGLLSLIDVFGISKDKTLYSGDSLIDQLTAQNGGVDFAAMLLGATGLEKFSDAPMIAAFSCFNDLVKAIL